MTRSGPVKGLFIDPTGSGIAEIRTLPDRSQKVISTLLNNESTRITTVLIDGEQYDIYHRSLGSGPTIPTVYSDGEPLILGPIFVCRPPSDCSLSDYHTCRLFEHIKHKHYTNTAIDTDTDMIFIQ